ncbi:brain-enriched guanylate kinase-associated protein isoform X2 [Falco rusticolus]|uniref:brain-enriched guanylate kinase-associated protein isoform X2 n=1 Tax=Falco cherrug TaxID=345164 RepID=UPI000FFBF43F|nr:brain-enriched guanylate kinase-associated protein isoform X2 [Falco cherrug]XP_037251826.1 brain-enriched guanylate kinase-associated protein isoform X2 [Falco rusticolus]
MESLSKGSTSPVKPEGAMPGRLTKQEAVGRVAEEKACSASTATCVPGVGTDVERKLSGDLTMNSYSKRCSSSEDSFELQGSARSEAKSFVKSKNKDEGYRPHRSKHCQKGGEKTHGLEHSSLYPTEVGNASQKLQRQKKTHKKSSSSASDLSLVSQGSSSSLSIVEEKIEAKLKFSQFINEVTFRVLDPMSLRAYRAAKLKNTFPPSVRSLDDLHIKRKSSESWKENILDGKTHEEVDLESLRSDDIVAGPRIRKLEKSLSLDTAPSLRSLDNGASCRTRSGLPVEIMISQSKEMPATKSASLPRSTSMASAADMEKISTLQEQKGELRKRLSYTTHKLEMLETEFDSTRQYLEIELRRAQEELEKVTEKLRRIQNNYLALQRINQDLEDKLYRMGQHYEEEKRALSHEIIALNNHLIEAKVTIDKLSEDNELYRKDCNLAAQLLQCSKNYDRAHKLSELPSDFQERVSIHLEKHGCSLSVPLCHTSYADTIPTCVIAKVLEKPDPNSLSSHLSSPSTRDLSFQDSAGKLGQRPQYKSDIYCSDTALYCPEERRRERRQSVDTQVKDVGFLRSQNSTDSTVEEDGFHSSFSHEAFPEYITSLPTSSSYSSFSVTSEEKENAQANTLTASQQAIYMSNRDELFERKSPAGYEHQGSPRFAKSKPVQHMELADDNENSPTFTRTLPGYANEPFHFSAITPQQALANQKMRNECRSTHLSEEDLPGRWRQLSVEDIGAYSYRNAGRLSPCSFSEQYYSSPIKKGDSRTSPIYASYKADSCSEGDDICQSRLVDSCFLRTDSGLNIDISTSCKQDKLPTYKTKEPRDQKNERITVQLCSSKNIENSPVLKREYVDVSPNSSAESLNQSSVEASEIHQSSMEQGSHSGIHSKQQQFQRTGSTGLSRKDSLTKAQLYGTLLN